MTIVADAMNRESVGDLAAGQECHRNRIDCLSMGRGNWSKTIDVFQVFRTRWAVRCRGQLWRMVFGAAFLA
jgi:hypothetical protein